MTDTQLYEKLGGLTTAVQGLSTRVNTLESKINSLELSRAKLLGFFIAGGVLGSLPATILQLVSH